MLRADVNEGGTVDGKQLWKSCRTGDLDAVKRLVEELGADVNQAMDTGFTAIEIAAIFGHKDVVRYLVESGADRTTALQFAVVGDHVDLVRFLVRECGVDISQAMQHLIFEPKSGDMVRCVVKLGADINKGDDTDDTPSIFVAIESVFGISLWKAYGFRKAWGDLRCWEGDDDFECQVECLVEDLGADVNHATNAEIAAMQSHTDALRYLPIGDDGTTALGFVPTGSPADLVRLLVEGFNSDISRVIQPGEIALIFATKFAAKNATLEMVRCLVTELGADVSTGDGHGDTPLIRAAMHSDSSMVQCLVTELGAVVDQRNDNGDTPLIAAAHEGNLETVRRLHELQANINQRGRGGYTALISAAKEGNLVMVRHLAELGAAVDIGDMNGDTALLFAAKRGNVGIVQCLIDFDADINNEDNDHGATALIAAAKKDNLDIMRCLVENGADMNLTNDAGDTALFTALKKGTFEMVRCLVDLGANIEIRGGDGTSALFLSARRGQYATVQFLLEVAGADIDTVNNDGDTVWDCLTEHIERGIEGDEEDDDPPALTALLRVMVLQVRETQHAAPALIALLSPENVRVVQEGARLQARLPAYLLQRRAILYANCPLLPPLCAVVDNYMELTTTKELWATGLGTAP
jgi:serine/threonine-protein phosphatase 6 regulatory ankyrin repeat subunit B